MEEQEERIIEVSTEVFSEKYRFEESLGVDDLVYTDSDNRLYKAIYKGHKVQLIPVASKIIIERFDEIKQQLLHDLFAKKIDEK